MPKNRKILLLALPLLFCVSLFSNDILREVRRKIQQIMPFKAAFVQQIVNEGEVEIEEHGELTFKNQNMIKWVYQKPDYKIFLLKDDEYRFYDHDYEQLTIGRVKDKKKEWVWRLLYDPDIVTKMKYDKKKSRLILKELADDLEVEIYLDKDLLPSKILQVDPYGYTRITQFKSYRPKVKLKEGEFILKVGKEVDIVNID